MKITVQNYTYETMPDYSDQVAGAVEIQTTGEERDVRYIHDVIFDDRYGLRLQILVPRVFNDPQRMWPCVVYVKGSAWMKQDVYGSLINLGKLAERGFVVAEAEYRHSGIAHFPSQIIDAKNAVRFMKAHAADYSVNPDQVIIMGDSSGGQVSAVAGMTAGLPLYDDPILSENCHVRGIIDLYGAVDVTLPYGFPGTLNHQRPDSPEGMLMGYDITDHLEEARAANAKTYVEADIPPILIAHGTKDTVVFCQESVDLYEALMEAGKNAKLYLLRGADHGGPAFWTKEMLDLYEHFMLECLVD